MTVTEFAKKGEELKQALDLIYNKYNGTPIFGKNELRRADERDKIRDEIKAMIFVALQNLGWDIDAGVGVMPCQHVQIFPIDDFHTELKFWHLDKKCQYNEAYRIQLNCHDFTYENTDYMFFSKIKRKKHTVDFFLEIEFKPVKSVDIPGK